MFRQRLRTLHAAQRIRVDASHQNLVEDIPRQRIVRIELIRQRRRNPAYERINLLPVRRVPCDRRHPGQRRYMLPKRVARREPIPRPMRIEKRRVRIPPAEVVSRRRQPGALAERLQQHVVAHAQHQLVVIVELLLHRPRQQRHRRVIQLRQGHLRCLGRSGKSAPRECSGYSSSGCGLQNGASANHAESPQNSSSKILRWKLYLWLHAPPSTDSPGTENNGKMKCCGLTAA
jgi:hypothetical protein